MIRILALLCLAAPAFGTFGFFAQYEKDLIVRFGVNPLKSFMKLPQTEEAAKKEGWMETTVPETLPEGYSSLVLLCEPCKALCAFYDDIGHVAGLLIAINPKQTSKLVYDWETLGYTKWIVDGELYWATAIYFSSEEYLKQDAAVRSATRDDTKLLQDKVIVVTDSYGKLHPISTDPTEIADTSKSNFTEQACFIGMGHHHYYKMTETLECNAEQLFKVFVLTYEGRFIGIGITILYGIYENKDGCTLYFEVPGKPAVKAIVPKGPQCLYELAENPGLVTMHLYFYNAITDLTCLS